jgi:hypothetical protein
MLMPAGVLVVLVLGALAIDSAIMFLGERELADASAAAANDAATAAIDPQIFYECGRLALDDARAREVAATVVSTRSSDAVTLTGIDIDVHNATTPPEVTVTASGTVRLIFSPALPGTGAVRAVQARSVAVPEALGPVPDGLPEC